MLYGTSCSGKSTVINILFENYNFIPVNCYTTRTKRENDFARTCISQETFENIEQSNGFLIINKNLTAYYGNRKEDIETAVYNEQSIYILDFLIKDYIKLKDYPHLKIIFLPSNDAQLILQINKCGRNERECEILKDYRENYSEDKIREYQNQEFEIVYNEKDNPKKTAIEILYLANKKFKK